MVVSVDAVAYIMEKSRYFCKLCFPFSIAELFQYLPCCLSNLNGVPAGVLREAQDPKAVVALFHIRFHFL